MNTESTIPPEFAVDFNYLQAKDMSHLMASLVALGAEVFLLKAEVQRLTLALDARGVVDQAALDKAAASQAFSAWASHEQSAFTRNLLSPLDAA